MEPIDATTLPALPAPFWLIQVFKVLGFTLHMVPMHLWYVGTTAAFLLAWKGPAQAQRLGARLMGQMPLLLALGINFGIVPLLFLQVGYCRAFYPATILMAWFWLAIIVLLIPAYYGVYVYAGGLKRPAGPGVWHRASGWVSAGLFVVIGFLFANGMSLTARPEAWPVLWARHQVAGAATGTALNLSDPTLWPRWLLMLGLALGTTAAWCVTDAFWLARQQPEEYRRYASRLALVLAIAGAAATTVFGLWYMAFWSPEVRSAMFGFPLVLLTLATGAGCWLPVAVLAAGQAWRFDRTMAGAVVGTQLVVLALNASSRQVVQNIELRRLFRPGVSAQPVATQWDSLALFLAAFVLGAGVIAWILVQLLRAGQAAGTSQEPSTSSDGGALAR